MNARRVLWTVLAGLVFMLGTAGGVRAQVPDRIAASGMHWQPATVWQIEIR